MLVVHVIHNEEVWIIYDFRVKGQLILFRGREIHLTQRTSCSENSEQADHLISKAIEIPPRKLWRLLIVHCRNFIVAANSE